MEYIILDYSEPNNNWKSIPMSFGVISFFSISKLKGFKGNFNFSWEKDGNPPFEDMDDYNNLFLTFHNAWDLSNSKFNTLPYLNFT